MAYEYDQLGNIIGEYESEEEKRLREAANQPVKQSITYNPNGTREMTIKGTPEALSSANPNTPTVSGPVSPEETYQRVLQAESGNRDYTASGQPVTSPKGAMFASQVMPSTAANPGYGVRPAQAQTPEEYNRVGREYFQALVKQFGGDTQKAAAAYNAGPGRVQQNIQQNQGQMNVAQLPKETQGYLQKIGNVVGNMIPSAQASTLPPGSVSPQQLAQRPAPAFQGQTNEFGGMEEPARQSMYSLGTGQPQQGLRAPQPTPAMVPDTSMYIQQYVGMQDDPQKLIQYGFNETVPEPLRNRAKNRAAELIQQQQGQQEAQQRLSTMTESELAKAMREKTTGGSYLKAALFGLLGMEQSAMAEAAKLGIGKETMTQINGQPAMIKVAANGTPISGYNATTGKKLTPEELVIGVQYGTAQKGAQTHTGKMQDMKTGEVYYERTTPQGIELVDNNGKKYTGPSNNLRPFGIGSDIQTKNQIQVNELTNKLAFAGPTERAKIVAENEAKYGPLDPAVRAQALGTVTGTVPTQATQAPGTQPALDRPGTVPAPAPGALTVAEREAQQGAKKEIITEAAKEVAKSADTQNMLNSINKITGLLDSGEHNVGSVLSGAVGRGPIAQAIGSQFETTDAKNTKTILDTVNKLAADGLKALGSNPSTVDLEFWTRYKPDGSSDPQFVKEWIQSRSEDLKRRLGFATSQVGAGGGAGTAPSVPPASQFKIISVEPGKK